MTSGARRAELVALARESIVAAMEGREAPAVSERPNAGEAECGVFVTLKIGGELRGCIGTLAAEEGIARTVVEFARHAAFDDPRFPPLTRAEWPAAALEISILSPPRPSESGDVVPGRDGIILELGHRRGLLLPQVATECGFNREQFLDAVSQKAGLPRGSWREPEARLSTFQAEVFGDGESADR